MLDALVPLIERGIRVADGPSALVSLAESYLAQGIREKGQNRGAMVEFFQRDGGGSGAPAPWCALFVSSCVRTLSRCGFPIRDDFRPTGRAISLWQNAQPEDRIDRDAVFTLEDPRGLIFVRTRLSRPISDRTRAMQGTRRQGHTGIVVRVDAEAGEVHCIAGNSSGHGHDSGTGTGAVAREVIAMGSSSWDRLLGFVRVTQ